MARSSSWRELHDSSPSRLPGPDNLGWWGGVAFLVAVILHVVAFFALGRIKIALGMQGEELVTGPVKVEQVAILPPDHEVPPPDDTPTPPPKTADLLEDIEILAKLPDPQVDLKPEQLKPEFAIKLADPALKGDPGGITVDPLKGFDLDKELPEFGRSREPLPLAAQGQIVIDPGAAASDDSLDHFAEDILRKGAGGRSKYGSLDGVVSLDDMVGLPADVLVGKKTMLPSDLLFEYNSAELRESARKGLMKLALLIDRNPTLYCWIEGHTDLYGGDAFNLDLSRRRAAAVKDYLAGTLRLPGERISVRGFGRQQPLVKTGTVEEQSPNRRVEIRMRRTPAPAQAVPPPSTQPASESEPAAPRPLLVPEEEEAAILVKPNRRLPIEDGSVGEDGPPAPRVHEVEEEMAPEETPPPRVREVEEEEATEVHPVPAPAPTPTPAPQKTRRPANAPATGSGTQKTSPQKQTTPQKNTPAPAPTRQQPQPQPQQRPQRAPEPQPPRAVPVEEPEEEPAAPRVREVEEDEAPAPARQPLRAEPVEE